MRRKTAGKSRASKVMRNMPTRWTEPERKVAAYLLSRGFFFIAHHLVLGVETDFFIPETKTAIFVDGCFFHGHNHLHREKTSAYWSDKTARSILRDDNINKAFRAAGVKIMRLWACKVDNGTLAIALIGQKVAK